MRQDSYLARFYRLCDRFTKNAYGREDPDLCTFMRVIGVAFLRLMRVLLNWMSALIVLAMLALAAYGIYVKYMEQLDSVILATAIVVLVFAAFIVACYCLIMFIALILFIGAEVDDLIGRRFGSWKRRAPYRIRKARGDGPLRIAGQWIYDRMHGICRKIEFV